MSLSHLAPYVRVSKEKITKEVLNELDILGVNASEDKISTIVNDRLKKEIKDSVQTFNYQINTMNSANGRIGCL